MNYFGALTDPNLALGVLRPHLDFEIRRCSVLNSHFKRYRKRDSRLRITYSVDVAGGGTQIVYADASDAGISVWTFPSDPALPQLAELCSSRREPWQVVNYRPETRCTIRYPREALYAKTFSDDRGSVIRDRMESLRREAHAFSVPDCLDYDPSLRTIWLLEATGRPLVETFDVASAARALASLHSSSVTVEESFSLEEHSAEAAKKASKLRKAFPALEKTVLEVMEAIAPLPATDRTLTHGDFHIRQLLADDGRALLLDYDELAMGDPAFDVANFAADLHAHGAQDRTSDFLDTYNRLSAKPISARRFDWHYRVQLLTRAYRRYLEHTPGVETLAGNYLELAAKGWA